MNEEGTQLTGCLTLMVEICKGLCMCVTAHSFSRKESIRTPSFEDKRLLLSTFTRTFFPYLKGLILYYYNLHCKILYFVIILGENWNSDSYDNLKQSSMAFENKTVMAF